MLPNLPFFGRVKCQSQDWLSSEVAGALCERRPAFAAAHKSDEDGQAYISALQACLICHCQGLGMTGDLLISPKSVYSLLRSVAGSSSSS